MNIENIDLKEYKNYKELCKYLEIPDTRGNTKTAVKKELKRYFDFYEQGQKFIFVKKYEIPLPKEENRGGNNNKYNELLDDLIIEALLQTEDNYIQGSLAKIFCDFIPMLTQDYKKFANLEPNELEELTKELNTTRGLINLYYSKTRNKIHDSFNSALKRLTKQNIIHWEEIYIVMIGKRRIIIRSDNKLFNQIKEAQTEICNEIGKDFYLIMSDYKDKKVFSEKIKEKLHINYYYKNYYIKLIKQDIVCPNTNIRELKKKYIINIHTGLLNKPQSSDTSVFYPYRAEKHNKAILKIDDHFWQGEAIIDNVNKCFAEYYYEELFGKNPEEDNKSIPIEESYNKNDITFAVDKNGFSYIVSDNKFNDIEETNINFKSMYDENFEFPF